MAIATARGSWRWRTVSTWRSWPGRTITAGGVRPPRGASCASQLARPHPAALEERIEDAIRSNKRHAVGVIERTRPVWPTAPGARGLREAGSRSHWAPRFWASSSGSLRRRGRGRATVVDGVAVGRRAVPFWRRTARIGGPCRGRLRHREACAAIARGGGAGPAGGGGIGAARARRSVLLGVVAPSAAGYFDHPPMIAWLIRAGTQVGGATPFGVRAGPIAAGFAGSCAAAALANRLAGPRGAWRLAVLLTVVPLAGVGLILATPDAPLLACAAAILLAVDHALAGRGTGRRWGTAFGFRSGHHMVDRGWCGAWAGRDFEVHRRVDSRRRCRGVRRFAAPSR